MTVTKQKKKFIIIGVILVLITISCAFFPVFNPLIKKLFLHFNVVQNHKACQVHFINVGQGDGIAINLPDGKVALIDTGTNLSSASFVNYVQEKVLFSKRNKKIDYLILTHGDIDHSGGVLRVLNQFDIEHFYLPIIDADSNYYQTLKQSIPASTAVLNYRYETILATKSYDLRILPPLSFETTNDACPLVKLEYKGNSFLFVGDISTDVEKLFAEKYGDFLDVDVLKVAHHGSKYSSSPEFLDCVTPSYAVVSVGQNAYGHPTEQAIANLIGVGAKVLRTDIKGNILFSVDKTGELNILTGEYALTFLCLDYRIFVVVVDSLLCTLLVVNLIKCKDKKK